MTECQYRNSCCVESCGDSGDFEPKPCILSGKISSTSGKTLVLEEKKLKSILWVIHKYILHKNIHSLLVVLGFCENVTKKIMLLRILLAKKKMC